MSGIWWLASYPKSGNTWMRGLLTAYFGQPDAPLDINALLTDEMASGRAMLDDFIGVDTSDLRPDEIRALRPAAYEALANELRASGDVGRPFLVKIHDAYRPTGLDRGPVSPEATAGAVYMVRNPLDVAVSAASFFGWDLERAVSRLSDENFVLGSSPDRLGRQVDQRLGSWSHHVRGWTTGASFAVLTVRYEDLLDDTASCLTRVIEFFGHQPDPGRIDHAVAAASFGALQAQEDEVGFREAPPNRAAPFFRRGVAGGWRDTLPVDLAQRIVADHSDVMANLGYATDLDD